MFDTALPEPPHEDLFGNGVHRALQRKGSREKVLEAAHGAVFQGQRGSLQEALTGRKGMRILNAASESLVRTAEAPPETAYSYSAWCLAGLPHRELPRDPESPDITPDWLIETGGARLLVRPGVRVLDDNSRVPLGVPFGSYARLLLIDWQTEALERGSREITIGTSARSPTHKAHPDSGGGEFDGSEIVEVMLFEAGRDGSEVFDLAEEPLDEVAVSIEEWTEPRNVHPVRHRFDVGPGTPVRQFFSQRVAVVGAIGKQDLTFADRIEHVASAATVMRLACRQLEGYRVAVGIDKGVDLGRQPAPRAPHAAGWSVVPFVGFLRTPFLTLAAC